MKERLQLVLSSYRVRVALGSIAIVAVLAAGWAWSLYAPLTASVAAQQRAHLRAIALSGAIVLDETFTASAGVPARALTPAARARWRSFSRLRA